MAREWTVMLVMLVIPVMGFLLTAEAGLGIVRAQRVPPRVPTGTVEGTVRFVGDPPRATRVTNGTDPEACGPTRSLEDVRVSRAGGIASVILALIDAPAPRVVPDADPVVLDNADCQFVPHASVATVGQTIRVRNSDPVLHTVHLYGPQEFNLSLPLEGQEAERPLTGSGLMVVKCDIHGWMQAFIRVDPHPFHAVTDRTGRFRITDIPPGAYTLESWHERFGRQRLPVTIVASETETASITYSMNHDRRRE